MTCQYFLLAFAFPYKRVCNHFLYVLGLPRSDNPIITIPLGASSEPVPDFFSLAACNGIRTFITTSFTNPRVPREAREIAFRQIQTYRPVHSEVRQYFHTILTMSINTRHIGNAVHLWTGFVRSLKTSLTVTLCRLHRAFDG